MFLKKIRGNPDGFLCTVNSLYDQDCSEFLVAAGELDVHPP